MKKVFLTTALLSLLIGATAISGMASSTPCTMSQMRGEETGHMMGSGMMGPGMMGAGMMASSTPCTMSQMRGEQTGHMMGPGMMNHNMMRARMMNHQVGHLFFLDRAGELGLSSEQVDKLKTLQTECRKDNIRNVAELNIVRLELADLLATDNWSLQDTENLVRKAQKMEGDIQVRHLQALNAARKILTEEQLKQARADGERDNLEDLFQ